MKRKKSNASNKTRQGQNLTSPYVFLLKEGNKIRSNFLDYSLMMFSTHCQERLGEKSKSNQRGNETTENK